MSESYGWSLLCEDVRHEMNGVISIVGARPRFYRVDSFPFTLKGMKLVVLVRDNESISEVLSLRIRRSDASYIEVSEPSIRYMDRRTDLNGRVLYDALTVFLLPNIEFDDEELLVFEARTKRGDVHIGQLSIINPEPAADSRTVAAVMGVMAQYLDMHERNPHNAEEAAPLLLNAASCFIRGSGAPIPELGDETLRIQVGENLYWNFFTNPINAHSDIRAEHRAQGVIAKIIDRREFGVLVEVTPKSQATADFELIID